MITPNAPRPVIRLALSKAEVALAIGVGINSIDAMIASGSLPPPRKWRSERLWLVSEVEAYLRAWPADDEARVERATSASDDRPFSTATLAKRWDCSEQHIRDLINTGQLPAFRLGRMMRITAQVVADLESRTQTSDGEPPGHEAAEPAGRSAPMVVMGPHRP